MADEQTPIDPTNGQTDEQITQGSALPQDNGTPAQPAADPAAQIDDTHPATDSATNTDSQEAYDAGVSAATGAQEPTQPAVTSFTPPADTNSDSDSGAGESGTGNQPVPPTPAPDQDSGSAPTPDQQGTDTSEEVV